jgi:hypothetical protein
MSQLLLYLHRIAFLCTAGLIFLTLASFYCVQFDYVDVCTSILDKSARLSVFLVIKYVMLED